VSAAKKFIEDFPLLQPSSDAAGGPTRTESPPVTEPSTLDQLFGTGPDLGDD